MRPPCEIIVQKVLPAIRAELARIMLDDGLPQQRVASRLGLSKAAISQYISAKRGKEIAFSPDTQEKIKELARSLVDELTPNDAVRGLCAVCKGIQSSGCLCSEHLWKDYDCTTCLKK